MIIKRYEDINLHRVNYDCVRNYCVCEKFDEEYMRSLIKRENIRGKNNMEMKKQQIRLKKVLLYVAVVVLLFILQKLIGKAGRSIADIFTYDKIDPYKAFAWVSIHHITELLIAFVIILILCKPLKSNFGFSFGDNKKGLKYCVIYTIALAVLTLAVHIYMLLSNTLPIYSYPLNIPNILGTLGFQLLLSGPAEEVIFRAIPITLLGLIYKEEKKIKSGISISTIVTSLLFALAHMEISFVDFSIKGNYFQLFYAFIQGIILGKTYEDTGSIFYPMYMHSISNVLMVGTGYLFLLL